MKKEWADKWVVALRSGKYKQATRNLKNEYGYCCLGVLCTLTPYKNNFTRMIDDKIYGYGSVNSVLPKKIMELVGMNTANGSISHSICLSSENDNGASFERIAKLIETHWEKL